MKNNNSLFSIYAFGVMLQLLYSMYAYFLWWMYEGMAYSFLLDVIVAISGFVYMEVNNIPIRIRFRVIIIFLAVWLVEALNPIGMVGALLKCPLSFLVILLLDRKSKLKLLDVWTSLFAVILFVSLIAWLFAMSGVLPSYETIHFGNDISYVYQNHILCLVNMNLHNFDVIRYGSIFLEPGHVSMIGAYTLYANRFDFKKKTTWVILIASLATFSLAGYVLIIIGYLMMSLQNYSFQKSIKGIILSCAMLGAAYFVTISYNNGDNLVNTLILKRTEYDSEKGFVGNNRVYLDTEMTFDKFMNSTEVVTGYDFDTYQKYLKNGTIAGAGYKMYLMEKGILGTLIVFFIYVFILKRSVDKRFVFWFFLLYVISFWQRAWPTSYIWLFLFVFATAVQKPSELYKSKIIVK